MIVDDQHAARSLHGDGNAQRTAVPAACRLQHEVATEHLCAIAHDLQPQTVRLVRGAPLESTPVVLDAELQFLAGLSRAEMDANLGRQAVARDVGQRLLSDAIQVGGGILIQARARTLAFAVEAAREFRTARSSGRRAPASATPRPPRSGLTGESPRASERVLSMALLTKPITSSTSPLRGRLRLVRAGPRGRAASVRCR